MGQRESVLINGEYILRIYKVYFRTVLNKKFPEENQDEMNEVEVCVINKMKCRNAVIEVEYAGRK